MCTVLLPPGVTQLQLTNVSISVRTYYSVLRSPVLEGVFLFTVTRPRTLILEIFKMKLSRYHWWYDIDGTEMRHCQ